MLDLVMQAPDRFAGACRRALESELPSLRPATVRVRSHLREQSEPNAAADVLDLLAERGSDGVILKAPDDPVVVEAIGRVAAAGVPVVTFVTDVPGSRRVAYAGVDNRGAGATAAYLVAGWAAAEGDVLVTVSNTAFRGEEDRAEAFAETLRTVAPARTVVEVGDTDGLDATMPALVRSALRAHPSMDSVYSPGGGTGPRSRRSRSCIGHRECSSPTTSTPTTSPFWAAADHGGAPPRPPSRPQAACRACRSRPAASWPGSPLTVAVAGAGRHAVQRAGSKTT